MGANGQAIEVVGPWGALGSKLHPPRLRLDALERDRVVDLLRSKAVPCVAVVAGAGYGKTTAVRQWNERDARRVAWVTVDRGDNDPVVFLRHLVRALGSVESMPSVESAVMARSPRIQEAVLPALGAALDDGQQPSFVLVLDDVHLLTDERSVGLLDWLIDAVPEGSQVVLCGRTVPPVHFARRLVAGQAIEIDQSELAFDADEARAVLGHALPDLAAPAMEVLIARTEGWPAGLHLAALALDGHPDPGRAIDALGSGDRRLAEYFDEELLNHLPEHVRHFLVRTSFLERLSGPLCDAVLEADDSAELLQKLASSGNHFVVAFAEADWFRYHHLFADLLLSELRRSAGSEEPALRRRAAAWLSTNGFGDEAVTQARLAGDDGFTAEIVYREVIPSLNRGTLASVERWLAEMPAGSLPRHALLALAAGWLDLVQGRRAGVEHWLETLDSLTYEGPLPTGCANLAVAVAALRMTSGLGGVKQTAMSAQVVKEAGPRGSPWWGLAWLLDANARYAMAELADPLDAFEVAEVGSRSFPPAHVVAVAHVALLHFLQGDDEQGQILAQEAADELRAMRLDGLTLLGMVHCVEAYAAARRGMKSRALAAIARAESILDTMGASVPRGIVHQRLVMAETALLLAEIGEVRRHLSLMAPLLALEPDAQLFHDWAARLEDHVSESIARADSLAAFGITTAELRVLQQLATHRSFDEIGRHLYVSRNTVKTHAISIYRRLGVSGRSAAVEKAIEAGLIEP
jgi:LuxR family maltose regulon positive regulatory protein